MEKQKDSTKDFIYPIPFDEFVEYREKQTINTQNNYSIHEFKKLKQVHTLSCSSRKCSSRLKPKYRIGSSSLKEFPSISIRKRTLKIGIKTRFNNTLATTSTNKMKTIYTSKSNKMRRNLDGRISTQRCQKELINLD